MSFEFIKNIFDLNLGSDFISIIINYDDGVGGLVVMMR